MISCEVLNKPGRWRTVATAMVLSVAFAPALPLFWEALTESSAQAAIDGSFWRSTFRSLAVAIAVAVGSLGLGVPAGIMAGLYDFPGRRPLLALLAIPLVVPSFLWAIGLSQFRIHI